MWMTLLMVVVTFALLVWFGMKAFSSGPASGPNGGSGAGSSASGAHGDGAANATGSHSGDSASGGDSAASSSTSTTAGSAGAVVGAAAVGAVAAGSAAAAGASAGAASRPGPHGQTATPIVYDNVTSGEGSVREMIKVLNLRESDASRLGIDATQFGNLWQGKSDGVDASTLSSVTSRLQQMMS